MDLKLHLQHALLFEGLADEDLRTVAATAALRVFAKGSLLISEGDDPRAVYVVIEGRLKAFVANAQGKELTLRIHERGACVGALELPSDAKCSASVMTLERCKLLLIPVTQNLKDLLLARRPIRERLVEALTTENQALVAIAKKLALMDVYQRVAATLVDLAAWENGKLTLEQRLTHQEIASRIGASREMVSHVIKDMVSTDYLRVEDNRYIIIGNLPRPK